MKVGKLILIGLVLLGLSVGAPAQMSRKPTPTREPKGAMDKRPDSKKNSLLKVNSLAEFKTIGRVYNPGTPYEMLHAMFVIDRRANDKIYFVNSQRFRFHKDFLFATGLAAVGTDIYKAAYFNDDRRFIVGTIAWQKSVEKWSWELWEGDLANSVHIKSANTAINKFFFEKVYYKPNSNRQDDASANIGIDRLTQDELNKNQEYLPLNTGKAIGRIHIIEKLDDTVEIGDNEIVILRELPISLPPVRGIIVAKPSSPLSHINILAKGWGVPNVFIKDADKIFKDLDTWWVEFEASQTKFNIKRLVDFDPDKRPEIPNPPDQRVAPVNLAVKKLTSLRAMRKKDSVAFGSKAANQGEIMNAKLAGFAVPDGFSIPFYWYNEFMKANGFDKEILNLMDQYDFVHNPRFRRQKLDEFRAKVQKGTFDEALRAEAIARWKTELGGRPLFVRSSSNTEDLPNFSGAGLYSSVGNVKTEDQLIESIKKVWGSLWKLEAYDARVRNYIDQESVYMSALIQIAINNDRSGVLISKDPFDAQNKNSVYISAVCGLGETIANNKGIPEQVLFNPRSNAVVLMTYSDLENSMKFDDAGYLKEVPDKCANPVTKRILSDAQSRALAKIAIQIRFVFGDKAEQDIEWGIMNGRIFIVQARPYIENK